MAEKRADLNKVRRLHAQMMAEASGSDDARLERIIELVPREAFLPPGPWQICANGRYVETPDADPIHLYQDVLVALDPAKGINNGEPYLHAIWLGAVAPRSGEVISHIGAGMGYYTAILSLLAQPGGKVEAFEIDEALARAARQNLSSYEGVTVTQGDATILPLPLSDVIYVNAGVVAPPVHWLEALRAGGRMIFPWRPTDNIGLTILTTRMDKGFALQVLIQSWFIPCVGASSTKGCTKVPSSREARSVRSIWLTTDRRPDDTAVAIYPDVWFSSASIVSH